MSMKENLPHELFQMLTGTVKGENINVFMILKKDEVIPIILTVSYIFGELRNRKLIKLPLVILDFNEN